MRFRKTKSGVAICPFYIWTSENYQEHSENDVNLAFCSHNKNKEDTEGNCRKEICPLTTEKQE